MPGGRTYNSVMGTTSLVQPAELARRAVDVASDMQGADIVMLDIRGVSDFADFFVISTAESTRQLEAVREQIEKALESDGADLHHREGTSASGWVLLDFGDLVVHLFGPEQREYYGIEEFWGRGVETVRMQ